MTPQEQQLLQGLTDRINQTRLTDKDPEAEQYLGQTLGRNPDALYILAQTVLVQQYALDQARQQLDQAKLDLDHARQVAQQPVKHTSFLGSLLGTDEPTQAAPPPPPPQSREPQYAPVNYAPAPPQPQYGQPQYAQAQYAQPGFGAPSSGGFLRSAMQTATGVAAGALAFEGIESLMHGFGSHAGYGGGGSGFGNFGGGGEREEVVNNYYGDASPQHPQGLSSDLEDRRDDNNSTNDFADTSSNDTDDTDDTTEADDSSNYDDSSSDDSGAGSDDSF